MIKKEGSKWIADIKPGGRGGRRFQKTFKTKVDAEQWVRWMSAKVQESPEWEPARRDRRRLSELVGRWFEVRGVALQDGEARKGRLAVYAKEMGDPRAGDLKGAFLRWRSDRLANDAAPTTLNNALAYLRALFEELGRAGDWKGENPLGKVRRLPVKATELAYLDDGKVSVLFEELRQGKGDAAMVAAICLATGARWSEAEELRGDQINIKARLMSFAGTKNGKVRALPLSECLLAPLREKGGAGSSASRLFGPCYGVFRSAVERAGLASGRAALPRAAPHLRQPVHAGRRVDPGAATGAWAWFASDDDAR